MLPATSASSSGTINRTVARDAAFVAQRFVNCFAERNATSSIKWNVVEPVTYANDLQAHRSVLANASRCVEKLDVGVDLDRSAVESEAQIDLRFFGRALDDRAAFAQLSAPTGFPFAPLWRWRSASTGGLPDRYRWLRTDQAIALELFEHVRGPAGHATA